MSALRTMGKEGAQYAIVLLCPTASTSVHAKTCQQTSAADLHNISYQTQYIIHKYKQQVVYILYIYIYILYIYIYPPWNEQLAPENGCLEYDRFLLGFGLFSGANLLFVSNFGVSFLRLNYQLANGTLLKFAEKRMAILTTDWQNAKVFFSFWFFSQSIQLTFIFECLF